MTTPFPAIKFTRHNNPFSLLYVLSLDCKQTTLGYQAVYDEQTSRAFYKTPQDTWQVHWMDMGKQRKTQMDGTLSVQDVAERLTR